MIPTRRLIFLALLLTTPLFLGGMTDIAPDFLAGEDTEVSGRVIADLALLVNVVLVIIAGVDLLISGSPNDIEVEREISDVLSVGTPNPAKILLRSKCRLPLSVSIHDDPGELCESDRLPQTVRLEPWKESLTYTVTPLRRGPAKMRAVHLRFPTLLGLWTRHQIKPLKTDLSLIHI